jgi:AcrR family transcriptional regulator
MPASEKRDQLVDTALALFNRDGYHATGIDTILAEAGVAKMTLYRHFSSKDELIAAALQRRSSQVRAFVEGWIERHAETPQQRVLAYFDALGEWFAGRAFPGQPFRGCMFLNAAAEFTRLEDPLRALAADSKRQLRAWLHREVSRGGFSRPGALADQLLVLSQGAIVVAQALSDPRAARTARRAAEALLERHRPAEPRS